MDGPWIVSIVFSFLIWLTLLLLNIQSSMLLNPAEIFLICQKHPGSKVSIKLSVYGTAIPPITVTTAKIANKSGFFYGELRFYSKYSIYNRKISPQTTVLR